MFAPITTRSSTFSSDVKAQLGRLRHLLAFLSLPGLASAAEAVLQGPASVAAFLAFDTSASTRFLYLRGTDQEFYAYKYRGIVEKNPSILAAGSSRMMKFRAAMFGDRAGSFYNAGGMLNSLRDVRDFCRLLPADRRPDVLLLGIDIWWLNEDVAPVFSFEEEISKGSGFSFDEHVIGIRWLLKHPETFAREANSLVRGRHSMAIGLTAREQGSGFRTDGSQFPLKTPRSVGMGIRRPQSPPSPAGEGRVRGLSASRQVSPDRLAVLENAPAERRTSRRRPSTVLVGGRGEPPLRSASFAPLVGFQTPDAGVVPQTWLSCS